MLYSDFLKSHSQINEPKNCPFCNISQRIIKKNGSALLTYALAPYHKYHLLVVPERHVESVLKIKPDESKNIRSLLNNGIRILNKLGYNDCTILVRDGKQKNRSINHIHYHIIPNTHIGDLDHKGENRKIMTPAQIKKILRNIRKAYK